MWDYFSYDAERNTSCVVNVSPFYTEVKREEALKKHNVEIQAKRRGTSLMYYQSTLKKPLLSKLCILKIATSTKQSLGSLQYFQAVLMLPWWKILSSWIYLKP